MLPQKGRLKSPWKPEAREIRVLLNISYHAKS
jgi:hypothetical protein